MAEPKVLITGTGGPSGVSFMQALSGCEVFSGDIDPYASGLYLVDADHRMLLPRGDDAAFVDRILELCERHSIDVLVPTVDTELLPLARRRDELAALGTVPVLASEATLEVCLDKHALHRRCEGEVRVPWTEVIDEGFDPSAVELPFFVKPRSGSGSRGIRLIERARELDEVPRDGTMLAQEHLPGLEYSLDTLAGADGEVRAVVPRARLKVDSGIAITGRTVHDEEMEAYGAEVARLIELTTVANVQVKMDREGRPALLEVNPRFPGTMPLTVASGVNMPQLAVDEALGRPMPEGMLPFEEIAMVRYFDARFFPYSEIEEMT